MFAHRLASFAITAALCAPYLCSQKLPDELHDAQGKLEHRLEDQVQAGAQVCVDTNSVPAAELLLDVMARTTQLSRNHLSAAHYRDVTFEYVTKLKDIYAQRRVALEVRKNRENAFARQWAAEALGFYGQLDHGATLVAALADKDLGVRRWAAWSLGKIRFEPALGKLKALANHADDLVRGNAIEALARIDPQFSGTVQAAIRDDKSGGVR